MGITPNAQKPNKFDAISQYDDGLSLYEYVSSNPAMNDDPWGLWESGMHFVTTRFWALKIGFNESCANAVAKANKGVDADTPAWLHPEFHFNQWSLFAIITGTFPKGRDAWANDRWGKANKIFGDGKCEDVYSALKKVGMALHGFQDATSHRWGGKSIVDGKGHRAHTAWHHVFDTANLANPHRPDSMHHFPDDWWGMALMTESKLRTIWDSYWIVRCICKKK